MQTNVIDSHTLDQVSKAIFDAEGPSRFSWEDVKEMAKLEGYIVAKATVELTEARAIAAINAMIERKNI